MKKGLCIWSITGRVVMQMEITIPSIISLMTLIIGYISKYLGLDSKYIPFQNIAIGVLSGILVYFLKLDTNIWSALVICLISALSAGGLYDSIKKNNDGEIS